mmetsp:Transcript_28159/g.64981  ORF Transcript_28159/g.64981 Transcript_28159/m.64981 type:complete len:90 (+) Transcript_28159:55-324(+)
MTPEVVTLLHKSDPISPPTHQPASPPNGPTLRPYLPLNRCWFKARVRHDSCDHRGCTLTLCTLTVVIHYACLSVGSNCCRVTFAPMCIT